MPRVEIEVKVKVDGRPIPGFPYRYAKEVDELYGHFNYEQAVSVDGATYTTLPHIQLDTVQAAAYRCDADLAFSLNANTPFTLSPGGIILLAGATVNNGATTNVRVNNGNAAAVVVSGFAGGS